MTENTAFSQLSRFQDEVLGQIEEQLNKYTDFALTDSKKKLQDAIRHSLLGGGKRVRPLLVLATFRLFERDITPVLPLACAMEMVHTYSLIHDDLPAMDDDDFRRGQPTCHKVFGEDIAILAGDTLNTYAFEVVARELPRYFSASTVVAVIAKMAAAFGIVGMSGGQAMDIQAQSQQADGQLLRDIHRLKTGAMLSACVQLPAMLKELPASQLDVFRQLGDHIGLLFQIVDDIIDVEGCKKDLGKSLNKDAAQQKLTYVSVYGLQEARRLANEEAAQAHGILAQLPGDHTILSELIDYVLQRTY